MFKKLKIKFVITIMILLTSIVSILFGVIYASNKSNNQSLLFSQLDGEFDKVSLDIYGRDQGPNPQEDEKNKNSISDDNKYNIPDDNKTNNSIKNSESDDIMKKREDLTVEGIAIVIDINNNDLIYYTDYENVDENVAKDIVNEIFKEPKNINSNKGFLDINDYRLVYKVRPDRSTNATLIYLTDCTWYYTAMKKVMFTFIVIGIVSLTVLFFFSLFIASWAIKPVQESYDKQKRFIGDASHELKTPLAIIKTNVDILNANKNYTIRSQEKWLNYIEFQTDRMSKLVSNLLYLAKADNNSLVGNEVKFNISDAIMNQILSFEAIAYENNLRLECNIDEEIEFLGDKDEISQLVGILVDNAIKHSYTDKEVTVNLHLQKQNIVLSVKNIGDTIKEEELTKIFDRFYRLDEARDRERGGYGLGLAIAKSIVEKYRGKIYATSSNNETMFIVEIPMNVSIKL